MGLVVFSVILNLFLTSGTDFLRFCEVELCSADLVEYLGSFDVPTLDGSFPNSLVLDFPDAET